MDSEMNKIKLIPCIYDSPSVCITHTTLFHNSNIYPKKSKHESVSSQLTFVMRQFSDYHQMDSNWNH